MNIPTVLGRFMAWAKNIAQPGMNRGSQAVIRSRMERQLFDPISHHRGSSAEWRLSRHFFESWLNHQTLLAAGVAILMLSTAGVSQNRKVSPSRLPASGAPTISPPTGPGLPSFSIEQNMDLMGDGYSRTVLTQPKPELCQDLCARDAQCRAFTFIKLDSGNAGCVLRDALTDRDPNPRGTLGIKRDDGPVNATFVGPPRATLDSPVNATFVGPPLPILDITFNNPPYNTSSPAWASNICGGKTFFVNAAPVFEWTQVLNPQSEIDDDIVGLSGTAIMPKLSNDDVPFTHPFGTDWEFFVAPDAPYVSLLAPGNQGPDEEYVDAIRRAAGLHLGTMRGVIGVETDQNLVPVPFRALEGDRVAVFGRWIADCGHSDFHTEIHPPLLLVSARPGGGAVDPLLGSPPGEATSSFVISRPWLVGQTFESDNYAIREHLINEVVKVETFRSLRVEAHPKIHPPFSGVHLIRYTVRPPSARRSPGDVLRVSFHFSVRHGVTVQVINTGSDAVGVLIAMNAASYTQAKLPRRNDWDIPLSYINQQTNIITYTSIADIIAHPIAGVLLSRDWLTDRYDAPSAASTSDSEITRVAVNNLSGNTPFAIDDNQPFPIYGQLRVEWERH